jgi:hypothetical protein
VDTRVRYQVSPCGVCGWHSGTKVVFPSSTSVPPRPSVIPTMNHSHSFIFFIYVFTNSSPSLYKLNANCQRLQVTYLQYYKGADKSFARPTSLPVVFSVQGTGGSPTGPDPENRVGDQDIGSPGRPVSSGLQVSGEPFPSWSG